MTTLPEDVIEFLKRIVEVKTDEEPLLAQVAQRLLDKYTNKVGPSETKDDPETVSRSELMMERMYGKETWTSMKAHWLRKSWEQSHG